MSNGSFFLYLAVMVLVTYLIRVIPYVCIRKEIKKRFFKSFMRYIPYTVLAVMTVPAILFATGNIYSAAAGLIVGIIVAYFERSLVTVALSTCGAVLIVELIFKFLLR